MAVYLTATIGLNITLFPKFLEYYNSLGIEKFLINVNAKEGDPLIERAQKDLQKYSCEIAKIWSEEFSEKDKVSYERETILRFCDMEDWVVYADLDEFQEYPKKLPEMIKSCEENYIPFLEGRLIDRVASDGSFRKLSPQKSLDRQYPLGGYITNRILGAWDKKIVLARANKIVGGGHHIFLHDEIQNSGYQQKKYNGDLEKVSKGINIHHFKWDSTILKRMDFGLELQDLSIQTGWHREIKTFHKYLEKHKKIDVSDPNLMFNRVGYKLGI